MFVDSHCHLDQLDLTAHHGNLEHALQAAKDAKVEHFLCVGITLENFPTLLKIAEQHNDVSVSVGAHPTELDAKDPTTQELIDLAAHPKVVAIGETGLDYYRIEANQIELQQQRFRRHIQAARETHKSLIIHTRQAQADTIRIMQEEQADTIGGVMHCFTETWEMAQAAMDLNFYISMSGIVTFKNATELQDVAKKVPLDRLLIETDSPYLAPMPYRGKPNEPAYVIHVAEKIAELRGLTVEEVARATTHNFYRCFPHAAYRHAP